MTFVLTLMKLNIGGSEVTKIVNVEARKIAPTSVVNASGEGKYLYETDNDVYINKLLNDHENVGITSVPTGVNTLNLLRLDFNNASEDVGSRAVPSSVWKIRTRPALMRAASTIHFFNA